MVKHNKRCTGLGGSTRRLHHKHTNEEWNYKQF